MNHPILTISLLRISSFATPDEDIELSEMDIDVLYDMCMKGEIEDSKTIIGILMTKEKL